MSHGITIPVLRTPLDADTRVPGSKSITNRALILAALAEGKSHLTNVLFSDDTVYMSEALLAAGFGIESDPDTLSIQIEGGLGRIVARERIRLFVGNAGTAMRFLAALLCLTHNEYELTGTTRMRERPIGELLEALAALGASLYSSEGTGCPPVVINGVGLVGGECQLSGNISSQFISAILMIAPYARQDVVIQIADRPVSLPYIRMTLAMMQTFGVTSTVTDDFRTISVQAGQRYSPQDYAIESDASSASYFLAAPAIAGGRVLVQDIPENSLQGDAAFAQLLGQMGARVSHTSEGIEVRAERDSLRGIEADMHDISDTFPTLAVTALFASGPTSIRNIANVRYKECDRITAVASELVKLGARVEEFPDGLTIHPPKEITAVRPSAAIATWDDHRMAMAFSLAGLVIPGVEILDPDCTAKTWPDYFRDLAKLTGGHA